MNSLITKNMPRIRALCKKHKVKSLFAFGSVCTDNFNQDSDIDLLISFEPMDFGDYADNYFDIAEKLENILQRRIDLITDKSLSNPFFIDSINKTKALLYGKGYKKIPA